MESNLWLKEELIKVRTDWGKKRSFKDNVENMRKNSECIKVENIIRYWKTSFWLGIF